MRSRWMRSRRAEQDDVWMLDSSKNGTVFCLHDLPKVTQTIVNDLVFVFEAFITLINGINKVK